MKDQQPDGSESRAGAIVAIALLLLAVPCLAGVVLVGGGAILFYRLSESPAVSAPAAPAISPPPPAEPEPPQQPEPPPISPNPQ